MKRADQRAEETYRRSIGLLLDIGREHYRTTGDEGALAWIVPRVPPMD
jgi:hypothetical protein